MNDPTEDVPTLETLPFQNIIVPIQGGGATYYAPRTGNTTRQAVQEVPAAFLDEVEMLAGKLREKFQALNGANRFIHHIGSIRVRATVLRLQDERIWMVLRNIPAEVPQTSDLNIHPVVLERMGGWLAKKGLILVSGTYGAGKTTTASCLFRDYLLQYGGFGLCLESPIEFPLEGPIGRGGLCAQIPVSETHEDEWTLVAANARKASPSILFIGEISGPAIARAALGLSTTGRPILATIHGGSIAETIDNLVHDADQRKVHLPRSTIAANLIGIAHQTLVNNRPVISTLDIDEAGPQLRDAIRENDHGALDQFVSEQAESSLREQRAYAAPE